MIDLLRRGTASWRVIIGLVVGIYLLGVVPELEYNTYNKDDAAFFYLLGFNLAELGIYSVDTFQRDDYGHHATWPPVFPMLLAGIITVFGASWIAVKLLMVGIALACLLTMQRALVLYGSDTRANLTVLIVAASPMFYLFGHVSMTEAPFMALSLLALALITNIKSRTDALLAGAVAIVAFYTRGYAIALIPAGVAQLLFSTMNRDVLPKERFVRCTLFCLPIFAGVLGWYLYTTFVFENFPLDSISRRFGTGAVGGEGDASPGILSEIYWFHLRNLAHVVVPAFTKEMLKHDMVAVFGLGIAVVAAVGAFRCVRAGLVAHVVWLITGVGLIVLFGQMSPRYWLTYLPCLLFFVLLASSSFWKLIGVILLFSNVALLSWHISSPDRLHYVSPLWKEHAAIARQVESLLPADAVVLSSSSHNFRAATGVESVQADVGINPLEMFENRPVFALCRNNTETSEANTFSLDCDTVLDRYAFEPVFEGHYLSLGKVDLP